MDINEVKGVGFNRHPWEISRTKNFIDDLKKIIDYNRPAKYLNIGSGDMYFDNVWINKFARKHIVYAVDIGYGDNEIKKLSSKGKKLFHDITDVKDNDFDYIILMDSLEYMEDDEKYINLLKNKLKKSGKLIMTLPAFSRLYSEHDANVGNLRRYDRTEIIKIINRCGLTMEQNHYFFFSLLMVRLFQKFYNFNYSSHEDVTTKWKYAKKSIITKMVIVVLDMDYYFCSLLSKIHFPGLSLLVVCKKRRETG